MLPARERVFLFSDIGGDHWQAPLCKYASKYIYILYVIEISHCSNHDATWRYQLSSKGQKGVEYWFELPWSNNLPHLDL